MFLSLPRFSIPTINEAKARLCYFLIAACYFIVAYYLISALCQFVGVFYNYTSSMREGVYVYYPETKVHFGDVVVVRPHPNRKAVINAFTRGYVIPDVKWVKQVVGMPDDHIIEHANVISITHHGNHHLVYCLTHDSQGKPLTCADFTKTPVIPEGKYFVEGTASAKSYDSRYLGLINRDEITNKAIRL